jgi:hypothetical protein
MKCFIEYWRVSLLAVVLVAVPASGQTISIDVAGDSDGIPNGYDPGLDGLTFDVVVEVTAPFGMTAWSGAVEAPPGYTVAASTLIYGTWIENYADNTVSIPPTNSSNWALTTADAAQWPAGPLNGIITSAQPPAGTYATSGFAVRFTVTAPADWAPGDTITYRTEGVAGVIAIGDEQFVDHLPQIAPLTMTPEPATALFVLAGLPLLRRRR